jgi:hypothetical protein
MICLWFVSGYSIKAPHSCFCTRVPLFTHFARLLLVSPKTSVFKLGRPPPSRSLLLSYAYSRRERNRIMVIKHRKFKVRACKNKVLRSRVAESKHQTKRGNPFRNILTSALVKTCKVPWKTEFITDGSGLNL